MLKSCLLSIITVFALAGSSWSGIVNGKASLVLGQPDFVSSGLATTADGLNYPNGIALDTAHDILYISDTKNSRILFWNNASTSLSVGKAADGAIGQVDSTTTASGTTASTLNNPYGICIDPSSNLWVADQANNRVLMFSYPPSTNMSASIVIGQINYTSAVSATNQTGLYSPYSVNIDTSGQIFVSDMTNNRTLVYKAPILTAMPATNVIGQSNFTSGTSNKTISTLNGPYGVYVSSYSHGQVFVADNSNNRVLVYPDAISSDGMNASAVIGQNDFNSDNVNLGAGPDVNSLSSPSSITSSRQGAQIWVADKGNNRVMMYTSVSLTNLPASFVIGQTVFTQATAACTQTNLNIPTFVFGDLSNNLWVADSGNNRVLRYDNFTLSSITCGGTPNRLVQGISAETVTITGTGLPQGCTVQLTKSGQTITGTNVSYTSEQSITCTFDLSSAATGAWNLSASFNNVVSSTVYLAGGCIIYFQNITSISPNKAASGAIPSVTLSGEGFLTGTVMSLTKAGQFPIAASAIAISSDEKQISGTFDLTSAVTGYWDIQVNTANISTTVPSGFFISTSTLISRLIDPSQNNTISIQGGQYGASLFLSTGVFSAPVTLFLAIPPDVTPPDFSQPEMKALNVYFQITNNLNLQPLNDVILKVFYTNTFAADLDQTKFRVCQYSTATGRWAPVSSVSFPASFEVVATINHFTWYGLFQLVPEVNLGNVHVYPNPYRPNSNSIYNDSPLGRGIVFAGLPARAQIKIFTITGELVKELKETTSDGILLWDTLTADGHHTASGVYIYLITSQDAPGSKKTGRFAIIE